MGHRSETATVEGPPGGSVESVARPLEKGHPLTVAAISIAVLFALTVLLPYSALRAQRRGGPHAVALDHPLSIRAALPPTTSPKVVTNRFVEASALQRLLVHLVALELVARQAKWNVFGPRADKTRGLLSHLAADSLRWAEAVSARLSEIGFTVDIRPAQVAATSIQVRPGRLPHDEVMEAVATAVRAATSPAFDAATALNQTEGGGGELAADTLEGLRRYALRVPAATSIAARPPATSGIRRSMQQGDGGSPS